MLHRTIFVALFLLAGFAPLSAQFVESIEVRVTNVDVVVTDRNGNPVEGLTKDDFEVSEDGKAQSITNFYEIRAPKTAVAEAAAVPQAEEPNAEARRRRILVFIDNYSIHPFKRAEVFKALDQHLAQIVRDGDEAMVVSWDNSLRVATPFTSDLDTVRSALAAIEKRGTGTSVQNARQMAKAKVQAVLDAQQQRGRRGMRGSPMTNYDEVASVIRAYAAEVAQTTKLLIAALRTMVAMMGGTEGKKVVIYAGAHLPENPALEMYAWLLQKTGTDIDTASQVPFSEAARLSLSQNIRDIARTANASGVTMYMIDTADPDGDGAESNEAPDPATAFAEFTNTASTFQMLARSTGGMAITGSRNFELAVRTVANDLASYYSLGYRTNDAKAGAHKVTVRAKNPAYKVRSRSSVVAKSNDELTSDRVLANIYSQTSTQNFKITISSGAPQRESRGVYRVPVTITMPSTLTLLRQGDELVGGFDVFVAVGDQTGATSEVTKVPQPVRIPASAEAQLRSQPIVWRTDLLVRKGESRLSAVVVDQLSNESGSAQLKLELR